MHPSSLVLAALLCAGCAVHQAKSDARRAWLDVTLDDPVEPSRVLAFLDSYDPMQVGDKLVVSPTVDDARAWLDAYRTESRHWIDEVVAANDGFEPGELPQATLDELAAQLVGVVLEMGPTRAVHPSWPKNANPYPWPTDDRELRSSLFGLYLQAGRLCTHATAPIPGCEIEGVNLPWALAAELLAEDPSLAKAITRPAEHAALEGR